MTRLILAGCCLLLGGCGGTETGNPSAPGALGVASFSSRSDVTLEPEAGKVHVNQAWLKVRELRTIDCGKATGVSLQQDAGGDLLSSAGPFSEVELAGEPLCGLTLTLAADVMPAAPQSPPELASATLLLAGTRADGAPFVLSTASVQALSVHTNQALEPSSFPSLLLGFDLGGWIEPAELDQAGLDTRGVAVIDGVTHPSAVIAFGERVRTGVGLYADEDESGTLDASELAAPLAGP